MSRQAGNEERYRDPGRMRALIDATGDCLRTERRLRRQGAAASRREEYDEAVELYLAAGERRSEARELMDHWYWESRKPTLVKRTGLQQWAIGLSCVLLFLGCLLAVSIGLADAFAMHSDDSIVVATWIVGAAAVLAWEVRRRSWRGLEYALRLNWRWSVRWLAIVGGIGVLEWVSLNIYRF